MRQETILPTGFMWRPERRRLETLVNWNGVSLVLDPETVNSDDEWAGGCWSSWNPAMEWSTDSFEELMLSECENLIDLRDGGKVSANAIVKFAAAQALDWNCVSTTSSIVLLSSKSNMSFWSFWLFKHLV